MSEQIRDLCNCYKDAYSVIIKYRMDDEFIQEYPDCEPLNEIKCAIVSIEDNYIAVQIYDADIGVVYSIDYDLIISITLNEADYKKKEIKKCERCGRLIEESGVHYPAYSHENICYLCFIKQNNQ